MQKQVGGYPALNVVQVDPGTVSRPMPPAHCAAAFESGADYHGATCAGRVPATLHRIFGWFEPGSSDFRSAGFEGRSILWNVHPTEERCLVHVGEWMDESVHEVDLSSGERRVLFESPKGLTAVYAGVDRVVTALAGRVQLYAYAPGGEEEPKLLDTLENVVAGRLVGYFHGGKELLLKASSASDASPVIKHPADRLAIVGEIRDRPVQGFFLQTFFEGSGRVFLVPFGRKSEQIFELELPSS